MEEVQITPDLKLNRIKITNVYDNEIVSICCEFSFIDKEGTVDINLSATEADYSAYISEVDMCAELLYSFNDQLQDHWSKIVKEVISFCNEYKKESVI